MELLLQKVLWIVHGITIKTFIKKNNIEVMSKCCPMDGYSKREDMKNLIYNLQKDIPNLKANLYGAIKRSHIKGWNKFT